MLLPRYYAGRSNVSELQAGRNVIISPAEAAQVVLDKGAALASAAKSVGDVFQAMADIKAKEEFTDAKMGYEEGLNKLDADIDSMPVEMDELGNPVYNPENVLKMERESRSSFGAAISGNIKSAAARRAFGEYLAASKLKREGEYQSKVTTRSALFSEASAMDKVDQHIIAGSFDLAHERLSEAVHAGVISASKYYVTSNKIDVAEESSYFNGITNAVVFDEEEAEQAIIEIGAGQRNGKPFSMNPVQLGTARTKIMARYLKTQKSQEDNIKISQFSNYLKLVDMNDNGDLTEEILMQSARSGLQHPELGISQADFERLQSDLGRSDDEDYLKDGETKAGVDHFSAEAEELIGGSDLIPVFPYIDRYDVEYNWEQRYQQFVKDINEPDNGLSYTTRKTLLADVNKTRTALTSDAQFKLVSKQAIYDVTGFEPDKITALMSSMDSQFKETIAIGNEFNRAVTAERLRLGSGTGKIELLTEFEQKNAPLYKLKINNALLKKVGVKFTFPESGVIDEEFVTNMQDSMSLWLENRMVTHPEAMARDIRLFRSTVDELERLNGIDIKGYMTEREKALVY